MSNEHSHPLRFAWSLMLSIIGVTLLCLGIMITLILLVVFRSDTHAVHQEGTIGEFASRAQAHDAAHRRVGILMQREPCQVTTTPANAAEDFETFQYADGEMNLHLVTIELRPGRWGVKWTADLSGSNSRNRAVINAWLAAAGQPEAPAQDGAPKEGFQN